MRTGGYGFLAAPIVGGVTLYIKHPILFNLSVLLVHLCIVCFVQIQSYNPKANFTAAKNG